MTTVILILIGLLLVAFFVCEYYIKKVEKLEAEYKSETERLRTLYENQKLIVDYYEKEKKLNEEKQTVSEKIDNAVSDDDVFDACADIVRRNNERL